MYFADTPTTIRVRDLYRKREVDKSAKHLHTTSQADQTALKPTATLNGALDEWFELTRPTAVLMSLF